MNTPGPGTVWLVGAGPGDPELLTLKAVRVLGVADVVLHDDLVNPAVLGHAKSGARIVAVGKRGGCRSTPQAFIERLMVQEALAGRSVVRLKGGDPYVFGRGGEEAEALRAHGIEVEVVHGITAGIAAPARLGIPVTHRADTHGVILVTGHAGDGHGPDWAALAATGMTLVVYMGVSGARYIQDALLRAGMSPHVPVAVVQDASLPVERGLTTTLEALARDIVASGIGSPAIIAIGRVVARAVHRAGAASQDAVSAARI